MMSLISFMACRHSCKNEYVLLERVYECVIMAFHVHLGGE